MDPAGLTVAAEGGRRFRALMDGHHRPGAPPKIGRTIRHATAGRRRAPAPGHHLHPRHHDRRRPGAWLARGSGIAVGGRTIGPAIDEGGRQTHVPGVSSRAASAQGKPCRSRAGTGMRRASGTGGRTAPSTTRPAGPGTGASCAAVMARRARNAPEGRPSVPSPGAARRRRRHCGRRTARSRKGRPGRDHGDPPARAGRSAAMSRVRHEASGGNPSCMIAAIPAKM